MKRLHHTSPLAQKLPTRAKKRSPGSSLRRRCPCCKKERKFKEPPDGERHPRRPRWRRVGKVLVCGWCAARLNDEAVIEGGRDVDQRTGRFVGAPIRRDAKTGKVIRGDEAKRP